MKRETLAEIRTYRMVFYSVFFLFLIKKVLCMTDQKSRLACQQFTADKQIKKLIEFKRELIEPCPCVKQKIELDYSFEKIGECYVQRFFENGAKQMCCYSPDGNIIIGPPRGGYMLFETFWKNMSAVQKSCCHEDAMCNMFYEINPSDDCSSYKPPSIVTSFGDPSIQTIDGNSFDFNGLGEYVFLKTSDLEIQVRLGYITPGNIDATMFEAFAIFDNATSDTFEIHINRTGNDIVVYKNSLFICNSSRDKPLRPCEMPPKRDHCMVQAGGDKVVIVGCGLKEFTKQVLFTSGELMSVNIVANQYAKNLSISGLAGHQKGGNFVFRNGTEISVNSTELELYAYGESWSLKNESESHFNYSITGGNYTFYNRNYTRPTFLEDLFGNLTALFNGYPTATISQFNRTCRNYWDNTPNVQCLLTIARSKDYGLGLAVMKTANETRLKWEILHNKAPSFTTDMPDSITAVNKLDQNITIDIKRNVWDDSNEMLTFHVYTELPHDEYTLENGIFTWNVSTGLRYIDTSLKFWATDRFNLDTSHVVTISYCGCEEPSQCKFDTPNTNSSENVKKAGCVCPAYFTGLYCETELDPCNDTKCYQDNCSMLYSRSLPTWPCAPCPKGRENSMQTKHQTCQDLDECVPDYSGEDKCEQNCTNTDGSFTCDCKGGYTLHTDKHSCVDNDECKYKDKCQITEYCVNTIGSYQCVCNPGYQRKDDKDSCVLTGVYTLEDAVDVKCSNSHWDVRINMDILSHLYPGAVSGDIYLGGTHCQGRLENSSLTFRYGINECDTAEKVTGIATVYSNKLFYAVFDPVIPFLIRRHIWTFAIECDVVRGGTGSTHLHHSIVNTHHATFVERYNVTVELFTDQNFQHLITADRQTVQVGQDVYVKVSSLIPDWNTKMRLHTCFTRPNLNATTEMEVMLIRDGCEVDDNTHIISQSTHETRFVFQDFEYLTNDEGLDVFCNATFCNSRDYSPDCVQTCNRNPTLIG